MNNFTQRESRGIGQEEKDQEKAIGRPGRTGLTDTAGKLQLRRSGGGGRQKV